MLRAESGVIWPSHRSDPHLNTADWDLYDGEGDREFRQKINFKQSFSDPPEVFLGLSAFDLIEEENVCITLSAANVTRKGMEVVFRTNHKSLVWSAAASYFVYDGREASKDSDCVVSGDRARPNASARLEHGVYTFRDKMPGWDLSDKLHAGMERKFSVNVNFRQPFKDLNGRTPNVVACISGIAAFNKQHLRAKVVASDATSSSFKLTVSTWGDSTIYSISVSWMAYDALLPERTSGASLTSGLSWFKSGDSDYKLDKVKSDDDDDDDNDDVDCSHHIMFPKMFVKKPDVIVCLSAIDIDKNEDYRIKSIERGLNPSGFDLVLGTWCGTRVCSATAVWVACVSGAVSELPASFVSPPSLFSPSSLFLPSYGAPPMKMPKYGDSDSESEYDTDGNSGESSGNSTSDSESEEEKEKKKKKSDDSLGCVDVRDLKTGSDDTNSASFSSDDTLAECKICFANKIDTVIIPCGHLCVCSACSKFLSGDQATCPICRSHISKIIKAYLS